MRVTLTVATTAISTARMAFTPQALEGLAQQLNVRRSLPLSWEMRRSQKSSCGHTAGFARAIYDGSLTTRLEVDAFLSPSFLSEKALADYVASGLIFAVADARIEAEEKSAGVTLVTKAYLTGVSIWPKSLAPHNYPVREIQK